MLPVNLLNAIKEYSVAQQKQLPVTVSDPLDKVFTQFDLGQKLQGIVQAQVAPNVFKVNISGQLVQMQLPPSVRSGDTVALQVVSLQPRLTFSMVNSESPLSTPEQLSSTARLLSSMSQQAPEKAYVRAAQSAPLWETPQPPESKQLAGMLHQALSNSGLFYESHQAQWLGGGRSTAQLLQEPQNLTPEQLKVVTSNNSTGNTTLVDKLSGSVTTGNAGAVAGEVDKVSVNTQNSPQANATSLPEEKSLGIPGHLQPLVQQQLNALETHHMMWQGVVWPGQDMQWEVHEQGAQNPALEAQRQWVTQIQLDLPNLGVVAATLRLNSAGLSLTLNADSSQTRTMLGSASTQLVSALSDAGIPVLSTQVANEPVNAPS
jgi:hypothetical protein